MLAAFLYHSMYAICSFIVEALWGTAALDSMWSSVIPELNSFFFFNQHLWPKTLFLAITSVSVAIVQWQQYHQSSTRQAYIKSTIITRWSHTMKNLQFWFCSFISKLLLLKTKNIRKGLHETLETFLIDVGFLWQSLDPIAWTHDHKFRKIYIFFLSNSWRHTRWQSPGDSVYLYGQTSQHWPRDPTEMVVTHHTRQWPWGQRSRKQIAAAESDNLHCQRKQVSFSCTSCRKADDDACTTVLLTW